MAMIGHAQRHATATEAVERAERELEALTRRLSERNSDLCDHVRALEMFLERTMPPAVSAGDNAKPVSGAPHSAHLSQINAALDTNGDLLTRLSLCVEKLERLG